MASYDFLQELLMKRLGGNNPIFDSIFGNARRKIAMTTDRAVRGIKQQGAQSGFRGISANLLNQAYGNESQAVGELGSQVGLMRLQDEKDAINGLLGLEQLKSQQTGFGDVLGGILGMGAGALTGGFGGALGGKLFGDLFGNMASPGH